MDKREKWVFAINFLRNKGDPIKLRRAQEWEKLVAVLHYVKEGIPNHYALTDTVMYKQVMEHIINLRIFGWANHDWKVYEYYANDPTLFEKNKEYFKNYFKNKEQINKNINSLDNSKLFNK